eukprot:CAMPEP_0117437688 /NCGR_PEP_ID=MMETSP0759-20121206/1660_1 /TAXON_ID=63605 /ORGANISM="Percolomonas cosmopolitus, Strain WS" /LENGTH=567 /DNA_ID=CAMNT_0005229343 /DNA_START=229 /DNA_END=1932 /DNA_ORIENTATION=-
MVTDSLSKFRFESPILKDLDAKLLHSSKLPKIERDLLKCVLQWRKLIPYIPDHLFVQIRSDSAEQLFPEGITAQPQVGDEHSQDVTPTYDEHTTFANTPHTDDTDVPQHETGDVFQTTTVIPLNYNSAEGDTVTNPTMTLSERMNEYKRRRDSDMYSSTGLSYEDFSDVDDSSLMMETSVGTSRPTSAVNHPPNAVNKRPESLSPRGDGERRRSKSTIGAIINKMLQAAPPTQFSTSGYVSPDASTGDLFQMQNGLKNKDVSLAVIDIQDFNELTTVLTASQIARLHSDYLDVVTACVRAHKGIVNHIFGDKLISSWNASHPVVAHEVAAVSSAFNCKNRLSRLLQRYRTSYNFPHVTINISVVSGNALVGVTGKNHKQFNILGQLFNELIHYSKLNKLYNTRILINEACYRKVSHSFLVRLVDVITICGERKQHDRGIFEAHSEKNTTKSEEWYYAVQRSKDIDQKFYEYNKAWICYMNGERNEALEFLDNFESKHPTDPHAARLRKRIEYKIDSNPLLDLSIRLHDARVRKRNSSTNVLYHSQTLPEKHEKIDLTCVLETGDGYI